MNASEYSEEPSDKPTNRSDSTSEDFYPSLTEPLRLRVRRATVTFDGNRVTINRNEGGVETLPVQNIASVSMRRPGSEATGSECDRLVFDLHNGRATSVDFGANRRQVTHFQDEVTRAIAALPPTGRRAPVEIPIGLVVFIAVVVALFLWLT